MITAESECARAAQDLGLSDTTVTEERAILDIIKVLFSYILQVTAWLVCKQDRFAIRGKFFVVTCNYIPVNRDDDRNK